MRRAAIAALVEDERVHRDLYLSESLFALEQKHFFANTWNYVGHASQVPNAGDYVSLDLAGRPLVMVRHDDGSVRVLYNRCAHKGTPLVTEKSGNTGRFFRCPYHAWTYRLDGTLRAVPLAAGYDGTGFDPADAAQGGMQAPGGVAVHRDFVFAKINPGGPDFASYFGAALASIDNLVDRSPVGRLRIEGVPLRTLIRCNWKTYLENINDTVHPLSTHESATSAAGAVWQGRAAADAPKPMAIEQILPFGSGHDFFDRMGARVLPNGHSVLGTAFSIHSGYAALPEYEEALRAAHGAERAKEILQHSPQNAICYPSLALKGSPQTIRVIRPLAADRTVVEAWSFRVEGAPDLLFERSVTYNRLAFSPMSVVAHDDLHLFRGIQRGLRAEGNEWVSLHRGFSAGELATPTRDVNGTNEMLMRNQFRAWVTFMTLDMDG
jgi:phenylpropionate dioxygenase-like ring-hydroxylating dioxygenase large terminal subunit